MAQLERTGSLNGRAIKSIYALNISTGASNSDIKNGIGFFIQLEDDAILFVYYIEKQFYKFSPAQISENPIVYNEVYQNQLSSFTFSGISGSDFLISMGAKPISTVSASIEVITLFPLVCLFYLLLS